VAERNRDKTTTPYRDEQFVMRLLLERIEAEPRYHWRSYKRYKPSAKFLASFGAEKGKRLCETRGSRSKRERWGRRDMLQRGGDGVRRVISDLNKLRYVPRYEPRLPTTIRTGTRAVPGGSCSRAMGVRTRGVENMNVIYLRYKGRKTGFPSAETTFELIHCLLLSPRWLKEEERERRRTEVGINSRPKEGGC